MLFPLWVYGIVWLVSGIAIGAVLVAEVPVLVVSASLALYSFASIGTGFSVLISTMDVGEVSAVGSSIAWLGYGFAAAGRAHLLIEGVRAVSSGGSE